ncbi:hypothetical protein GGH94_003847 [Coemansia aciculifera]|uniref:alpha-1,2-Mannosidase n=1 Tax=Coemansia aciculifera TaxID=417176 RepID=A0A9W8ILG4_9FUNG|nr:hypothetical protein GGH94_003847 [Coemansia aciculifera]
MRMRATTLAVAVAVLAQCWPGAWALGMTKRRRMELREKTKESFYHAYNGYMENAFPFDEVSNINVNDVMGDYLLTLVDTLDTLAIFGDMKGFQRAVNNTIKYLPNFDIDSHVQIFEVTIRMLGGLLSAHIIATDEKNTLGMRLDLNGTYNGELLHLARDLGYRLLPAFEASPNAVPYPRTNLKNGFTSSETSNTCAAGIGTLLLEFGTLSRLTNETIFEDIARSALNDVWAARSKKNLFGNDFDLKKQRWVGTTTGVGAGVDSLFEYMLKSYIYFGDEKYLRMFESSYAALLQYSRDTVGGYAFFNIDMRSAEIASSWVDSLSAFIPGMMVLAGDVDGAESAYMLYYHIWRRFRALPERFNLFLREPDLSFYPLRPEFVESTYFLYRATRDPFYLDVGEMVLEDINQLQRTACGYASRHSVSTLELEERMESFFLSETMKYLYLLFDDENPLHSLDNNYVFTTEAHVLLPLSPVREAGSAQYPRRSSFSSRKLIHSDRPPKAVKPLFCKVDNIRKKLRRAHPDDLFSQPRYTVERPPAKGSGRVSLDQLRQCPMSRALTVHMQYPAIAPATRDNGESLRKPLFTAEWKPVHLQSPLVQLHTMRELSRAICDTAAYNSSQREYLVSLYVNGAVSSIPLRADFYDIGALVDNDSKEVANKGGTLSSVAVTYTKRIVGTTVLNSSLDMALEYLGLCIKPSLLYLSEGHEAWASNLAELEDSLSSSPPRKVETWLTPNTRQIPFMEFLLSRATNASLVAWNIPHQPRVRHGVPLLKDVWDEELGQPLMDASVELATEANRQRREAQSRNTQKLSDAASQGRQQDNSGSSSNFANTRTKQQQRRRGYYVAPGHIGQQRQVVITNGAGQVMTDFVVVRASTDAKLQEYVRASPVHDDSIIGLANAAATRPPLPGAAGNSGSTAMARHRRMQVKADKDDDEDGEGIARQGPKQDSTLRDDGSADSSGQGLPDEHAGGASRLRLHLPSRDAHRRREYAGRLADFAEMSLYQEGQVSQPTTLIMLHLYSSSAAYGCEEYTPREQKMAKRKVVAVRVGGGCTVWEKAIHATNAGASALLVDGTDIDSEHNSQQESQSAGIGSRASDSPLCSDDEKERGVCQHDVADSASKRLLRAVAMPVVEVDPGVIGELEEYLVAGLHVRVELL